MEVRFFNREVENPALKTVIVIGAAVFAVALVAAVFALLIPVLAAVLTGVFLIVAVVLLLVLVFVPIISVTGLLFSGGRRGSGVEKTVVVETEPFDSLKVSGKAQVVVTCGKPQSVTVTTDDNLTDLMELKVSKGRLTAGFKKHVYSKIGMRLDVTLPELKSFRTSGAASVQLLDVNSSTLDVRASGASRVNATGRADSFSLRISGAGKADASKLAAKEVSVKISGAGKADVFAEEKLEAHISGAGNISCAGNPGIVEKHISGAGKVIIL